MKHDSGYNEQRDLAAQPAAFTVFFNLITTQTQLNNETRRSVVAEVASRRPIRAVK